MLLSIIIPTFNSEKHIGKTLSSIGMQKYDNHELEIIIIDGISSDNTIEIINEFNSIPIRIISGKDRGIYDAMNKGIDVAEGKFCYFIGAGDTLVDGVLQEIFPQLRKHDGLLYGNVIRTNGNVVYDGEFSTFKIFRRNICHQAIFYPTNKLKLKKYHYDLKYKVLADYNLNLLLFSDKKIIKKYMDINVAYYDDLSQGFSSKNIDHEFHTDYSRIIENNFSLRYRIVFMFLKLLRMAKKVLK